MYKRQGLYEWGEEANKLTATALYTDMDINLQVDNAVFLYATITDVIKGFGGYMIAQLLQSVDITSNGNIVANYTTDEVQIGELKISEIDMNNKEAMSQLMTFIMQKLYFPVEMGGGFTAADIEAVTTGRHYTSSSQGLRCV